VISVKDRREKINAMTTELSIPKELHHTRDALVSGFFEGRIDPEAESSLANWLLSEEGYTERMEGDDAFGMMCDLSHSDGEIRAWLELTETDPIRDPQRVQFARERMWYVRENGTDAVHIDARLLADSKGRHVIAGLSSVMMGQGGMDFEWLGLFESVEAMIDRMLAQRCVIESFLAGGKKFDDYSDQELLVIMKRGVE
jgi:hypothetical protein